MRWIWILLGGLGTRVLLGFWWSSKPTMVESIGTGWLMMGIFLAPIATISALIVNQNVDGGIDGLWWGIVMFGVLLDLTVYSSGTRDSRLNKRYQTTK
jgi:hypothetical protein